MQLPDSYAYCGYDCDLVTLDACLDQYIADSKLIKAELLSRFSYTRPDGQGMFACILRRAEPATVNGPDRHFDIENDRDTGKVTYRLMVIGELYVITITTWRSIGSLGIIDEVFEWARMDAKNILLRIAEETD